MRRVLLNPGPVTISDSVRNALSLPDNCHREKEMCDMIRKIRNDLVSFAGGDDSYTSALFVSSGTGALESVLCSIESHDYILIISNGAYGERAKEILDMHKRFPDRSVMEYLFVDSDWGSPVKISQIKLALESGVFSHVFVVHHETTTGILNPIKEIGKLAKDNHCTYIVDAISSFGGIPFNIKECNIDFLIGTANKCIQGVPGLSFVIAKKREIEVLQNSSQSYYFNLYKEWKNQEEKGMFRFTSPVQVIYAFNQALDELRQETIDKRYQRYSESYDTLLTGFKGFGFKLYPTDTPSKLLATFIADMNFSFDKFHDKLYDKGYVIYPGKLIDERTFRIAVMGNINKDDINEFLKVSKRVLREMEHD